MPGRTRRGHTSLIGYAQESVLEHVINSKSKAMRQAARKPVFLVAVWLRVAPRVGSLAVVLLQLVACASAPPLGTREPAYPTGTVLQLHIPVTVRAKRSGTWLGGGPIAANPRREQVRCRLEIRQWREVEMTIQPDQFTVVGVAREREQYVASEPEFVPIDFATNPGQGAESGWILVNSHIYLRSEWQPEVLRLTCQQARDDFGLGILTPADLEPVLAGIITVMH
jgi:hypothetical protein